MNIQDFHIKHNYFIKAKQIDDRMITVEFPENSSIKPILPKLLKTYILTYDGVEVISSDKNNKYIICPDYAKRIYISQNISITAYLYGLSEHLILSYKNDGTRIEGKRRVVKLLKRPDLEKDFELEQELHALVIKMLSEEKYEVKPELKEGFDILVESMKQ